MRVQHSPGRGKDTLGGGGAGTKKWKWFFLWKIARRNGFEAKNWSLMALLDTFFSTSSFS